VGVLGDVKAKTSVADAWPPYTLSPTFRISNKQPPSGGYAAFSPKGEARNIGRVTMKLSSAHYALSSGFLLAQA